MRVFRTDRESEWRLVVRTDIVQLLILVDPCRRDLGSGGIQLRSGLAEIAVIHQAGPVFLAEEIIRTPADLVLPVP